MFTSTLPINVIPNSIGRERSDRRSKSSQHNLKDFYHGTIRQSPTAPSRERSRSD